VNAGPRLFPGDLLAEFLERSETRPRARLEAMTASQREAVAVAGWHCGFPRCAEPAGYLSSLRYATRAGREQQRGRFVCDGHAARFAARHHIDMAAARPPEVTR
jgi:hypothetical protein